MRLLLDAGWPRERIAAKQACIYMQPAELPKLQVVPGVGL